MPTISFIPAQIEQFRRDAKRLARNSSIKLSDAQNQIALSKGIRNWSLLIKHSSVDKPITAISLNLADERPRYYIHGDQVEGDVNHYYCRQCDLFIDAQHFSTSHGEETYERALQMLESWDRRKSESRYQRPLMPPNILLDEARRRRKQSQGARSEFHQWLEKQLDRGDPIADLAHDVMCDTRFPYQEKSLPKLVLYLERRGAVLEAVDALENAWGEFQSLR